MPGLRVMHVAVIRGNVEVAQYNQPRVLFEFHPDMVGHLLQPVQLVGELLAANLLAVDHIQVQHADTANGGAQDASLRVLETGEFERALDILEQAPPDVFNHNLETVAPLYRNVRPGADYDWSLRLLQEFKRRIPGVPTKSGIMLGLGETRDEVLAVMADLRRHAFKVLKQPREAPFFLYLHYFDPHDRYQAPRPFTRRHIGRALLERQCSR